MNTGTHWPIGDIFYYAPEMPNYLNAEEIIKVMITNCPECQVALHEGQHRYADGIFHVQYCKKCGFRKETPIEE